MTKDIRKISKGIRTFNFIYFAGVIFATGKLLGYLQWTSHLIRKGTMPTEPFFSKVNLANSNIELSVTSYIVFAIAYIVVFGFILLGLYQLNQTTKLFAEQKIFQEEVGVAFKKAGHSFLAFAFGTLIIDVALLAWANTSSRIIDLLSTELLVFMILGYLMFFLSDVFKEGITIKEENELTI